MRGFTIEAVPCHTYSAHIFENFAIHWFNICSSSQQGLSLLVGVFTGLHISLLYFSYFVQCSSSLQDLQGLSPTPIFVGESRRWCVHQHLHIVMASWQPPYCLQDLPWRRRHRGGDPVLVRRRRGGCTSLRPARRAEGEDHDPVHGSVIELGGELSGG